VKDRATYYWESIANSYSQLFFSLNKVLAVLLIVATFFQFQIGITGLFAVLFTILFSKLLGLNTLQIKNGIYGYNSLLIGLSLGFYFQFNSSLIVLLIIACTLNLIVTICFEKIADTYKIPILSAPFIISFWLVLLSVSAFKGLSINFNEAFTIDSAKEIVPPLLNKFSPFTLTVSYFKSLAFLFFQHNIFAGVIVAIGILIFSRIAFAFSIIGFVAGYFYTSAIGNYTCPIAFEVLGFNYILLSIAIGTYFLIPSIYSILLILISIPLVDISTVAFIKMMQFWQLPIFSLPFTTVTLALLILLKSRYSAKKIHLVNYQTNTPETNLYAFKNNLERFKNETFYKIELPFFGEWKVSQGHKGSITHKGDYSEAWDFVVTNEQNETYKAPASDSTDFFCFGLPILAPASGYVVALEDGVEDNKIGDVNTTENWGNTIVIKHADFLFSKISHIKKNSFKVKKDDYVKKGDVIAYCGNSGRSPEPHLHFQLQLTQFVGSKTLKFPIAYYLTKYNNQFSFHSFDYPKEGDTVSTITPTPLINKAFRLVPGMILNFDVEENFKQTKVKWEIFTDATNQSYIYCHNTKSYAYFVNNDTLFYFINFSGKKYSLLHHFYLAAYKVVQGYYKNLTVTDALPIYRFFPFLSKITQDLMAPFMLYLKVNYESIVCKIDDEHNPTQLSICSKILALNGSSIKQSINYELILKDNLISSFCINVKGKCIRAHFIK
jgi:urea transporter